MKRKHILITSFCISLIGIPAGTVLKIMHAPFADLLFQISFAFYLVFAVLALYEVFQSSRIEKNEKFMWTIGFIFLGTLVGILYLVTGRKRIVNNFTNENLTSSSYEY